MKPSRTHTVEPAKTFGRQVAQAPPPPAAQAAVPPHAEPVAPPHRRPAVAVIAIHGMGSQVPFTTTDLVASRIADIAEEHNADGVEIKLVARAIKAGDDRLSRLELKIDKGKRDVHVYEAYWAPLTEGRIGVKDVLLFLIRAGWKALWHREATFKRWMFGGMQELTIAAHTRLHLLLALLFILSLVGLNIAAVTLHALRAAHNLKDWTLRFSQDLTFGLAVVATSAIVFGLLLLICYGIWSRKLSKEAPSLGLSKPLTLLTWTAFFGALVITIGVTVWLAGTAVAHRLGWTHPLHPAGWATSPWAFTGVYAFVFGVSWFVKGFVVQYVGDVAAYVYSYRLDKFDEIRSAIKKCAATVAKAVYEMTDDHGLVYSRVVFVGHSLGSVVAYDTLNRLLSEDDGAVKPLDVLGRTKMLLTFGSPLDKTAFLFRMQGVTARSGREALAAVVQPLIQAARFRPAHLQWVNVSAAKGADLIGSPLDYYNGSGVPVVRNLFDEDASVPVASHNQHWDTDLVWTKLHDRLRTC